MRRDFGCYSVLVLLAGLAVGFAWLTRYPDAEVVRRAEGWPGIGPLATRFREAYEQPPEPPPGPEAEVEVITHVEEPLRPVGAGPQVWIEPGMELREKPEETAKVVRSFDVVANVPELERRGAWRRVRWRGSEGWVHRPEAPPGDPPLGRAPEPTRPLEPSPPDAEALAEMRALLGVETERRVGPYTLYTDSRNVRLLGYLDRVASGVETVYRARYRREPLGTPQAAVVLFADPAAYREVQKRSPRLAGLRSAGHATTGLAVFYDQGSRWSTSSVMVHEIVHLINRRAVGPALPPWLDEGIAEEMSLSAIDASAVRLLPGTLGGTRSASSSMVSYGGGVAALVQLRRHLQRGILPSLESLMTWDWQEFVNGSTVDVQVRYALSAFWVRYLLDAEKGRHAEGFRAFLDAVASGEPATGEALREHLGVEVWRQLEAGFRVWLELQVAPL